LFSNSRTKLLAVWLAALLLSGGLAWAGQRWPAPLPIDLGKVVLLVLGPPVLMGLWLLLGWTAGTGDPGRTGDGGESLHSGKEHQG
jgi:hypothetical protein